MKLTIINFSLSSLKSYQNLWRVRRLFLINLHTVIIQAMPSAVLPHSVVCFVASVTFAAVCRKIRHDRWWGEILITLPLSNFNCKHEIKMGTVPENPLCERSAQMRKPSGCRGGQNNASYYWVRLQPTKIRVS